MLILGVYSHLPACQPSPSSPLKSLRLSHTASCGPTALEDLQIVSASGSGNLLSVDSVL